jgi:hypothetical protein
MSPNDIASISFLLIAFLFVLIINSSVGFSLLQSFTGCSKFASSFDRKIAFGIYARVIG